MLHVIRLAVNDVTFRQAQVLTEVEVVTIPSLGHLCAFRRSWKVYKASRLSQKRLGLMQQLLSWPRLATDKLLNAFASLPLRSRFNRSHQGLVLAVVHQEEEEEAQVGQFLLRDYTGM